MSKHLTSIPLPNSEGRSLERQILVTGIHARLVQDGILLNVDQIQQHLFAKLRLPVSQEQAQWDLDNLLHTWQRLPNEKGQDSPPLSPERILELHRTLMGSGSVAERSGGWRQTQAGSTPLDGVPPDVIGLFMEEFCDWLNGPELTAPTDDEAPAYAIVRSLLAELYWTWIRPFGEGNARVIGTITQEMLVQGGASNVVGHVASEFFVHSATTFRQQTAQAAAGIADPIPFLTYAIRGISDGLRQLHERIRTSQTHGQWRAQLLDLFSDGNDAPTRRQRQLLLDLGERANATALVDLPTLSPALARLYAGVSKKTLRRDVDALVSAGILRRSSNGIRVEQGAILAFKA